MSHKVAKKMRKLMRNLDVFAHCADNVAYNTITHVKLTKQGGRYERYQIVMSSNCGRAKYQRWKKKFKFKKR